MTSKFIPSLVALSLILVFCAVSCSSRSEPQPIDYGTGGTSTDPSGFSPGPEGGDDDDSLFGGSGCRFEDNTYSAMVDYYNEETGYSQTYTLDVEVSDCEVVQINFPNGGWLDSDHIAPAELDEDGRCTVYGEGKTYEIQINY